MVPESQTVITFIVRMTRDDAGGLRGVIERAATGAKQPVESCEAVGAVIAAMLAAERKEPS
jgi:hypothetical protein